MPSQLSAASNLTSLCLLAIVASIPGCPNSSTDENDDSGTSDTTASPGSDEQASEGSGNTGQSSESTSGDDGQGSETTGDDGGETAGTSEGDPDPVDSCAAKCTKDVRCFGDDYTMCVAACEAFLAGIEGVPACEAAYTSFAECYDQSTCEGWESECAEEAQAVEQCGCSSNVSGPVDDPSICSIDRDCPNGYHRMDCDAETCTCWFNEEQTGSCASRNVCTTFDPQDPIEPWEVLEPFAFECCGF